MAVPQNGWSTVALAETYFTNERSVTTLWDALADNDAKNNILNEAYNRIYYSDEYDVPETGDETAAQLIVLIKAQSEMSYYLLMHLADEDRRKGIQAQGVTSAGIVKEVYDRGKLQELPIPPIVRRLLSGFFKYDDPIHVIDIDRDENEPVSDDATEF